MTGGCRLCPRECGARRDEEHGELGFCKMPLKPRAARAALHYWEEPCISGSEGSGAVFFSGCTLRCVFCQNQEISQQAAGAAVSEEELTGIFLRLQAQRANNINLVTAGHFLDTVIPAIKAAKKQGLAVPVVYNTGGYEKQETLRYLEGLVDVWLPDYKYRSSYLAEKYSHAPDYPTRADAALREMVRQAGEPQFDERGMMKKGVLVRHLALPSCVSDSKDVLEYLWDSFGNQIYISILGQYTPMSHMKGYPELNRRLTEEEYGEIVDYARFLGMTQVYIQEGECARESFIPAFDCEGIL